MKQTVYLQDFKDAFKVLQRDNAYSEEGKEALYEYLTQYEEETGAEIELDVIAFCCEYTEYNDFPELKAQYWDIKNMDDLRDHTKVIDIANTGRFIIRDF